MTADNFNLIYGLDWEINEIKNVSISGIQSTAIFLRHSIISLIEQLMLMNNKIWMTIIHGEVHLLTNSIFDGWGSITKLNGGGINNIGSNTTIKNTQFMNNKAVSGAGIAILWDESNLCGNTLENNTFTNNTATKMGGGIYYNYNRPIFQNIQFNNNSADYGPNIASYAVKIIEKETGRNKIYRSNVASGLEYNNTIHFDLVDYDGQIMKLENSNTIKIISTDSTNRVSGTNYDRITDGWAELDNLIFISETGKNVSFKITSGAIDSDIITNILGNSDGTYDNTLHVSFRYWEPGEIETSDKRCEEWQYQTYSFDWNATECKQWMDFATWSGKDVIEVDNEYWRYTTNSSKIIECPNIDACKGGYHPNNLYPVEWTKGYKGVLWSEWDIIDGVKYQPLSDFQWSKCPNPTLNALRVFSVVLISFLFLLLLIYINLRKRKENQFSILLRIFTNYIHLIAASLSFNVKVPSNFSSMFHQVDRVSSPNETFFSFDCFINDYEIKFFAPSNSLFKLFLYMFLPVMLLGVIFMGLLILRLIIHLVNPMKQFDFKRTLVVSMIWVLFLFHPTLTIKSLSVFLWTRIDENEQRMTHYLEYNCYSFDHLRWILFVGAPMLIFWVILCPLVAFFILYKNRNNLDEWRIKKYFLIIYQGLKPSAFYWEFVATFRKFALLTVNALTNTYSLNYKIFFSISEWLFI